MGISTAFIPFFDAVNSYVKISDPFLSLGSLQVNDEPELVENFCRENCYTPFNVGDSIYSLLHQRYGISAYESIDINGEASINFDLSSKELPRELYHKYNTIYDGGTAEHIFDIATVFRNVHDMLCVNDICIHILPLTCIKHGYYNFTMDFFKHLIQVNSYKNILSGYFIPDDDHPAPTNVMFGRFHCIWSAEKFYNDTYDLERSSVLASDSIKKYIMMGIAYQKKNDSAFVIPNGLCA